MKPALGLLVLLIHVLLACAVIGLRGPVCQFLAAWGVLLSLVGFAGALGEEAEEAP